ncbi:hypothetical protein CHUAL_006341 [Chamberlinius hualienensis]
MKRFEGAFVSVILACFAANYGFATLFDQIKGHAKKQFETATDFLKVYDTLPSQKFEVEIIFNCDLACRFSFSKRDLVSNIRSKKGIISSFLNATEADCQWESIDESFDHTQVDYLMQKYPEVENEFLTSRSQEYPEVENEFLTSRLQEYPEVENSASVGRLHWEKMAFFSILITIFYYNN